MTTTRAGRILVKTDNKESADILRHIASKEPEMLIEDKPRRPRIKIINLDSTVNPKELPRQMAEQNPELGILQENAETSIFPIFKKLKKGPTNGELDMRSCSPALQINC